MKQLKVVWRFEGNEQEKAAYNKKEAMYQKEYMTVYNKYCDIVNNGVTDGLNTEWQKIHPGPVADDNDRYFAFMSRGYNMVISRKNLASKHMSFSVGNECEFIGHPKTGGSLDFVLSE